MSDKKKVIFCTYSSIYSSKILEQLLVDTDIEVVAIINSTRVLSPSFNPIQGAIHQLKTSGLRYSAYLFFITDFFKLIQPVLKLGKWPLGNIHSLAKNNNITVVNTKDINSLKVVDFLKEQNADYLLCAHFNQLLKKPVFAIKNIQCINIHPSLLPKYKGVDPVFFSMRDNAEKIGVSLHRMNQDFDSGDILLQAAMKLDKSKSLLFNNCQLFEEGVKIAVNWIKNDIEQTQVLLNNNVFNEDYDSWPSRDDVKNFTSSGKRLMNLSGLWKQQ